MSPRVFSRNTLPVWVLFGASRLFSGSIQWLSSLQKLVLDGNELGLIAMLLDDEIANPGAMADAIRALPGQARPRSVAVDGILDGLKTICELADGYIAAGRHSGSASRGAATGDEKWAPARTLPKTGTA